MQGQNKVLCGQVSYDNNKKVHEIHCGLTVADHIRIVHPRNEVTLCEVEVYGRNAQGEDLHVLLLLKTHTSICQNLSVIQSKSLFSSLFASS
jgi:hypothetical protein